MKLKLHMKLHKIIILAIFSLFAQNVQAVECTPYTDCRYQGAPLRDASGAIDRDTGAITAYRKLHPCPSTGLLTGACPGWALNHNCPLACGCVDAVWNFNWVKNEYKTGYAILPKDINGKSRTSPLGYINEHGVFVNMQSYAIDRVERKINASNPPQPDTGACVNVIIR